MMDDDPASLERWMFHLGVMSERARCRKLTRECLDNPGEKIQTEDIAAGMEAMRTHPLFKKGDDR
jgi:hypothetical protein